MPALLNLTLLADGDEVHHPLLICDVVLRAGDHPRTILVFSNSSGRIESAPFWAGRDELIRGLSKGMLVQVVGRVASYRDALQVEATSLRPLPKGSVALADLVPSVGSVDKYWEFIDDVRSRFTAPRLRAVVDLFYADPVFRDLYGTCPGAPRGGHHSTLGGLLQHTCEVLVIARSLAKVAKADEELVIAGALLHDIGKLEAYSWEDGVFDTTVRGRLLGHVVPGVNMLRDAYARTAAPPCTPEELLLLEHMIVSHHGQMEFGAPVPPLTLEAEVLHFADNASAKTASINEAYASPEYFRDPGATVSSKRVWSLERHLVKLKMTFGRNETGRES